MQLQYSNLYYDIATRKTLFIILSLLALTFLHFHLVQLSPPAGFTLLLPRQPICKYARLPCPFDIDEVAWSPLPPSTKDSGLYCCTIWVDPSLVLLQLPLVVFPPSCSEEL
eukprot:TRINITY_DN25702_c0_g1_i1.p1 TRINITY_DN25702_c0_g1~~TRINITY_DN25702_c0_g1_i1.p1  ORF type:complete len:111 (-),score=8.79 TRINITY_DN25702_c0_g1_i1:31-363(-)